MFDMKTKVSEVGLHGLTMLDALVLTIILVALAAFMMAPAGPRPRQKAQRISCVNNLKQVGLAYRIWDNDNGNLYPMQQKEARGGMKELLSNSFHAGQFAYLPCTLMQNELGQSPKIVICPADERMPNTNFFPGANVPTPASAFKLGGAGSFDNSNVSYFCGVGALDTYPQSVLGGDRNLGDGGYPNAPAQDPYYGISGSTANPSPNSGADAIVNTNGIWVFSVINGGGVADRSQRVAWSAKMHSCGNTAGAGNILLGDGSAQQCTSASLRQIWLKNAVDLGNFAARDKIHSTNRGDIRLLFP